MLLVPIVGLHLMVPCSLCVYVCREALPFFCASPSPFICTSGAQHGVMRPPHRPVHARARALPFRSAEAICELLRKYRARQRLRSVIRGHIRFTVASLCGT